MEYALLIKVGMLINGLVKTGYCVAGGYGFLTIKRYVEDSLKYHKQEE